MRIYHALDELADTTELHLAIGIFDGVHLGHQAVIDSAVQTARSRRGRSGVLTFTPHPSRILRPSAPTELLQPPAQKEVVLRRMGLDLLIWLPFSFEFAAQPAEDFLPNLKRQLPPLRSVHIGENFRFGKGRNGDVTMMVKTARPLGMHVLSVERLRFDGEAISSTRIRDCLRQGGIEEVNNLLGYNYFSNGKVQPGRKLGRELGFPTLNLHWEAECRPRFGVYAVRVWRPGEATSLDGVANYGVRPTVDDTGVPLLEVHLLDGGAGLGEGDELVVEWLSFIRPEQKFPNLDALKVQIATDRDTARVLLERRD